jgi:TPR repeat protein
MEPLAFVAEIALWGSIALVIWGAALTLQHVFASDRKPRKARETREQRSGQGRPERLALWVIAATLMLPTPGANAQDEYERAMEAIPSYDDDAGALEALRTGAASGDSRAQEVLGFMLLNGERLYGPGVRQDVREGLMWLRRAAEQGSAVAGFIVARAERAASQGPTPVAEAARPVAN